MWPPFTAPADAKPTGDWSLITRPGGAKQWAYKTRPLYTFSKDTGAGQTAGNGYDGNTWHLAKQ
jgi:predicted lipoprotein with Yx(FWY)xxD motif